MLREGGDGTAKIMQRIGGGAPIMTGRWEIILPMIQVVTSPVQFQFHKKTGEKMATYRGGSRNNGRKISADRAPRDSK